ncbi:CRISPR-associated endonuclease Cas1 [Azonexus sp.]|uniref:CRISPR-associated endonuclease Cas1 n=1 Tax=Azonexus sp. TaxID=1872668 RepID=UPI0035B13E8F
MSLLDLALTDQNLLAAWQRVCDNDGAPGGDGITLEAFGANLTQRLAVLRAQVRDGRYVTQPLLRIALERPGKTPRLLGIPAVRDRVLQSAFTLVLTPLIDPRFAEASFGYRPGRSVAQAVQRVIDGRDKGLQWVVDADISSYFDTVAHESLLKRLVPYLPDASLLPIIEQWLAAPVKTAEGMEKRSQGLPQGSPISPLFANLYLNPLDELLTANPDWWLVRYADDFVILTPGLDEAEQALERSGQWLEQAGLELNFDKTRIASFALGFDFLGVHFQDTRQWAIDPHAAPWVLPRHLRPVIVARSHPGKRDKQARQHASPKCPSTSTTPPRRQAASPLTAPSADDSPRPFTSRVSAANSISMDTEAPPLLRTLYLAEPGAYLHRQGERIVVSQAEKELLSVPVEKIDQVYVTGEGAISFGALRWLLRRQVAILVADQAGEPQGAFRDETGGQVALRRQQWQRLAEPEFILAAARSIVVAKIANGRLILRRYYRYRPGKTNPYDDNLAELQNAASKAATLDAVRGHEGAAARTHFAALRELLAPQWQFNGRSRRAPGDPVNALLSYGYGILYHTMLNLIVRRGLDPHSASLHAERQGHAALASDLMEEFRPLVVDALVLKLLLSGRAIATDFEYGHEDYPVRIGHSLRKRFIGEIEGKLSSPLTHPRTGKTTDYRRCMLWQVAHWSDVVTGACAAYEPLVLR